MAQSRLLALVVAGVLAAPLAGCGEDREGSVNVEGGTGTETTATGAATATTKTGTTPAGATSKTFKVSEIEFKLTPSSFRLAKPGVVEFTVTNDGGTVHALEVEGPSGEFETEEIQPGDQVNLKADVSQAGTYEIYCPVGDHEDRGMVGELVVGKASGDGGNSGGATIPEDNSGSGSDDSGSNDDSGGATAPCSVAAARGGVWRLFLLCQ